MTGKPGPRVPALTANVKTPVGPLAGLSLVVDAVDVVRYLVGAG